MSDQVFWFATRGAGILAWFAATLSVSVGLMMSSRVLGRRPTLPWLLDVHRFLGAMSVVFLAVHLFTLWADSFVTLTVADLIIPGRAEIPGLTRLSMTWGVIAGWLLVLVQATSLIKNYLPPQFWHTLHLTSFGTVILGLVHAIQVGSDAENRILVTLAVTVLTAVVLLAATRGSRVLSERKHRYDLELSQESGELERMPAGSLRLGGPDRAAEPTEPIDFLDRGHPTEAPDGPEPLVGGAPTRVRAAPPSHREGRGSSPLVTDRPPTTIRPGLLAEAWADAQTGLDHPTRFGDGTAWSDDDADHAPHEEWSDDDAAYAPPMAWSDDGPDHARQVGWSEDPGRSVGDGPWLDDEPGVEPSGWFGRARVDRSR